MNNREKLNSMTNEELGHFFCNAMDTIQETCDICPVHKLCRKGHNGFVEWLSQEAKDNA